MKYVRQFQTGTGRDPRDKWIAVYKCDACGNEEWLEMYDPTLYSKDPKTCPKCHSLGAEDLRKTLENKMVELQAQEIRVRAEIDKVIQEINQLEERTA